MLRGAVAVGALALVVGVSGCAAAVRPPAHSASTQPTPAPPRSTLAPTVAPFALTADGLGPLRVGAPVPDDGTAPGVVEFTPLTCTAEADGGAWVPTDRDQKFIVLTVGAHRSGAITSIGDFSSDISTAKGIHVGSSVDAVRSAYPDATVMSNNSTDIYVVNGTLGHLIIEVTGSASAQAGMWPAAQQNLVYDMRAEPLGDAVHSVANTDAYGVCPG
ncbi:MAG TPA: hypothetical protein VIJ11_13530 [Galbitalea sp.]